MEDFFTVTEFSKLLKVSRQSVFNWIKEKKIKYAELPSGHYRIPKAEYEKIMKIN